MKYISRILATLLIVSFGVAANANPNIDHLRGHGPADGEFSAWTKVLANGTQMKFYAKYLQPGEKVQFMVQNEDGVYEQLAWKRVDSSGLNDDGSYSNLQNHVYFIRTYDLKPGKNRVRILVDGELYWGTKTYSNKVAETQSLLDQLQTMPRDCGFREGESTERTFEQTVCGLYYPKPEVTESQEELYNSLPSPQTPVGLQEHLLKIYSLAEDGRQILRQNYFSPGVDMDKARLITEIESRLLSIWVPLGVTEVGGKRIWVSPSEYDYWYSWAESNGADSKYLELWNEENNRFGSHCTVADDWYCVASSNVNGVKLTTTVLGPDYLGQNIYETAAHEMLHTLQGELQFSEKCWWTEGTAMIFSNVLGFSGRVEQVARLKELTGLDDMTVQQLASAFENNTICDGGDWERYVAGMFAVEYLLLNWSMNDFFDLWVAADESGWETAVAEVLGVSGSQLDQALGEHLRLTIDGDIPDADYGKPWEKSWSRALY